ncbi:MAG TPA: hypothetical protein VFM93_05180 [Candidatus Limnocylindria bacterium]|nr:hypothetical protein [Candidatus Limnocylindria bacterium]
MREDEILQALEASERALQAAGRPDLRSAGFWRAVGAVKRDPRLVERYAGRIAAVDRAAFLRSTPIALPAGAGVALLAAGTAAGAAATALAGAFASPVRDLVYLAGVGALLGATHALAHFVTGTAAGIRFTHFFSAPPRRPQPGFKTDYASYLRTPARSRAWMHASGAIVTKAVPFVALPFAAAAGVAQPTLWILLALGIVQLATDALWSVKASDWKKFRREMRAARAR